MTENNTQSIIITEREDWILQALCLFGPLTTDQINKLKFDNERYCQIRLKLLSDNGFTVRQEQDTKPSEPSKPLVHSLGTEGLKRLVETQYIESEEEYHTYIRTDSQKFPHHVQTSDCIVSALNSFDEDGYAMTRFDSDPLITTRNRRQESIPIPDAYMVFSRGDEEPIRLIVEADTGSQHRGIIADKVLAYYHYISTPEFWDEYLDGQPSVQAVPILIVVQSDERLKSLAEYLIDTPGSEFVMMSTLEEVRTQNFKSDLIWRFVADPETKRYLC